MFNWIKWLICRKELEALDRYRIACSEVSRWNASIKTSSQTAEWINAVGEGVRGNDIEKFRAELIGV